jgi:hypothetical protein
MNEIIPFEIGGLEIKKIIENPSNFSDEEVWSTMDMIEEIKFQLRLNSERLKHDLIRRLENENATVFHYKNVKGKNRKGTLSQGTMKAEKNIDLIYQQSGFDPLEIGDYEFRPSWAKAKKAMKVGGEKRKIIESKFKNTEKKLKIEDE